MPSVVNAPSAVSQDFFYRPFDDAVFAKKIIASLDKASSLQDREQAALRLKHASLNHTFLHVAIKQGIIEKLHETLNAHSDTTECFKHNWVEIIHHCILLKSGLETILANDLILNDLLRLLQDKTDNIRTRVAEILNLIACFPVSSSGLGRGSARLLQLRSDLVPSLLKLLPNEPVYTVAGMLQLISQLIRFEFVIPQCASDRLVSTRHDSVRSVMYMDFLRFIDPTVPSTVHEAALNCISELFNAPNVTPPPYEEVFELTDKLMKSRGGFHGAATVRGVLRVLQCFTVNTEARKAFVERFQVTSFVAYLQDYRGDKQIVMDTLQLFCNLAEVPEVRKSFQAEWLQKCADGLGQLSAQESDISFVLQRLQSVVRWKP